MTDKEAIEKIMKNVDVLIIAIKDIGSICNRIIDRLEVLEKKQKELDK